MPKSLKDQLAKTGPRSSAPSLIPAPTPKKERPEAEVLPDMRDVIEPQDRDEIVQYVTLQADILKDIAALKKTAKPITGEIKKLLTSYEDVRFMVGDTRVVHFNAPRSKLNARKLMALGVTPQQIAAATDVTDCWTLRISTSGEDDEDET